MTGSNQLDVTRDDVDVTPADLLKVPTGHITEDGLRHNIRVGIQYIEAWLGGNGCVPLYHLMEDAATAEISRAQIWQWIRHGAETEQGTRIDRGYVEELLNEEMAKIEREVGEVRFSSGHYETAAKLFANMVTGDRFDEFLTLPAYEYLP